MIKLCRFKFNFKILRKRASGNLAASSQTLEVFVNNPERSFDKGRQYQHSSVPSNGFKFPLKNYSESEMRDLLKDMLIET